MNNNSINLKLVNLENLSDLIELDEFTLNLDRPTLINEDRVGLQVEKIFERSHFDHMYKVSVLSNKKSFEQKDLIRFCKKLNYVNEAQSDTYLNLVEIFMLFVLLHSEYEISFELHFETSECQNESCIDEKKFELPNRTSEEVLDSFQKYFETCLQVDVKINAVYHVLPYESQAINIKTSQVTNNVIEHALECSIFTLSYLETWLVLTYEKKAPKCVAHVDLIKKVFYDVIYYLREHATPSVDLQLDLYYWFSFNPYLEQKPAIDKYSKVIHWCIRSGVRFGCLFALYPGNPDRYHSTMLIQEFDELSEINLIGYIRVAMLNYKKLLVLSRSKNHFCYCLADRKKQTPSKRQIILYPKKKK